MRYTQIKIFPAPVIKILQMWALHTAGFPQLAVSLRAVLLLLVSQEIAHLSLLPPSLFSPIKFWALHKKDIDVLE